MINEDEIGVVCVAERCRLDSRAVRDLYYLILDRWRSYGLIPNKLAVQAPGFGMKYTTHTGNRTRLDKVDWEQVQSVAMSHLGDGGVYPTYDWLVDMSIAPRWKRVITGCLPSNCAMDMKAIRNLFHDIIQESHANYGYIFQQPMYKGPCAYAVGVGFASQRFHMERPVDLGMNVSWWNDEFKEKASNQILRDVYPVNYLVQSHLFAPIGLAKLTLREWIEADPIRRGSLNQITEKITEWRTPIKQIPQIREELFRAGRLFYWRFCNPSNWDTTLGEHVPEPYLRPDLSAPWEAPEPIPEIFTAEFYKDKDPGLTY